MAGDAGELLPHFQRVAETPLLPDDFAGVSIVSPGIVRAPAGPVWPLRGAFRLAAAELEGAAPEEALRRLVVVVTDDESYDSQARHVLEDEALFPEDVLTHGGHVSGAFSVDLLALFELPHGRGKVHVLCSLGEHVSEPITVAVTIGGA